MQRCEIQLRPKRLFDSKKVTLTIRLRQDQLFQLIKKLPARKLIANWTALIFVKEGIQRTVNRRV